MGKGTGICALISLAAKSSPRRTKFGQPGFEGTTLTVKMVPQTSNIAKNSFEGIHNIVYL